MSNTTSLNDERSGPSVLTASPPPKARRNFAKIAEKMSASYGGPAASSQATAVPAVRRSPPPDAGLTLTELEDRRWAVSPTVACAMLTQARLRYEGRRGGLIYSWTSIFRAEGVADDIARQATRQSHPELFEDLLDTAAAATFLGYRDSSSIRKLVATGDISSADFVKFGTRGIYRFRPAGLVSLRGVSAWEIV